MQLAAYKMVINVLFVTTTILSGGQPLMQGEQLETMQESHEAELQERSEILETLRQSEQNYRVLLGEIDRLKEQPDTVQNRMELRELLRESRTLSEELRGLQRELHETEETLENQRGRLVAAVDERIGALEQQLAGASSSQRSALVSQLNELRSLRQKYTAPMPSAPSDRDVTRTLQMASQLEGAAPEDLLAAADELKDTEDQVRKRLGAIEERLQELREAKMLARRARTFAAEERFFDETERSQFVGGYGETPTETTSGNDNASQGDETQSAPSEENAGFDEGDGQPATGDDPDSVAGGGRDTADDSEPSAPPGDGANYDDSSSGGQASVFDSQDSVRLDSGVDPEARSESGFESDYELDSRIERLEDEQKRLEDQAESLEEKAGQLEQKAHQSLE